MNYEGEFRVFRWWRLEIDVFRGLKSYPETREEGGRDDQTDSDEEMELSVFCSLLSEIRVTVLNPPCGTFTNTDARTTLDMRIVSVCYSSLYNSHESNTRIRYLPLNINYFL